MLIQSISVIIITAALFLAMIISLAAKPAVSGKITGLMLIISGVGGLFVYGAGYSYVTENQVLATAKALLAVCGMFVGNNDLSAISGAPWMSTPWMNVFFWILHLFALYTSASAAITTIGAEALKTLRLALSRRGELTLIYGTNAEALALGKEINANSNISVVFISDGPGADAVTTIGKRGAALRSDKAALNPDSRFLRSLGMRKGDRKLRVYLMESQTANYEYAVKLRDALKAETIRPEQTSLVILGEEDTLGRKLQNYRNEYGFGNVSVFQKQDPAARLMIAKCPPWENISFDKNGRATEDFTVLIVGFGLFGQSALKALIRNGQYVGSTFKAVIMDPAGNAQAGYMETLCPGMFDHYNIEVAEIDGRCRQAFQFLKEHADTLKYIVISTGDHKISTEVAGQMQRYLQIIGKQIPVVQCSATGVTFYRNDSIQEETWPLISQANMNFAVQDEMAMYLNHYYCGDSTLSLWDAWENCDYFSRMSSRAFADYIPAFLTMLHTTEEHLTETDNLQLTEEQQDVFGETEHLRWCAFHYTMGFAAMQDDEWENRANAYRREIAEQGHSSIRIGKNMVFRTHCCLIPWEELDALSEKEMAVTGVDPIYKQKDLNNILNLPALLKLKYKG